ncbi:MAG TPA: hypothetical protein VFP87_01640, partial [Chitinophagaceae bacterium]|nr:hypothetical protein [Chitinophagaceae bacterium]
MIQKSCNVWPAAGMIAAVFSVLMLTKNAASQDCSCAAQFSFVKDYFETNNPAFQKLKRDAKALAVYTKKLEQLTAKIRNEQSNDRCNVYFDEYVALLKDHHSHIDPNLQRLN